MSNQTSERPWRGVITATALPFNDDLSVDYESYAAHVQWLADSGTHGVCPSGSLGEYQVLTPEERSRVLEVAVQAAPEGFCVMPGVGSYGSMETVRLIDEAARAGAHAVLLLPPNSYRAGRDAVLDHFRAAASVGLPVIAYNNPLDTKVDMAPELLAELHAEGLIQAVKEFSGDVRRAYEIREMAPELDLLVGSDDVLLEVGAAGAVGWVAGYTNAFPRCLVHLYDLVTSGDLTDLTTAMPIYRDLHPLLRWDSKTEFVQAIKLSMDVVGRKGGPSRPPRSALAPEAAQSVIRATESMLANGYS